METILPKYDAIFIEERCCHVVLEISLIWHYSLFLFCFDVDRYKIKTKLKDHQIFSKNWQHRLAVFICGNILFIFFNTSSLHSIVIRCTSYIFSINIFILLLILTKILPRNIFSNIGIKNRCFCLKKITGLNESGRPLCFLKISGYFACQF